ncbi:MAG: hypothetical protein A2026_04020, partial [Deltaproteobacteria bacterium RBG_19FT_COMBO_46_12]
RRLNAGGRKQTAGGEGLGMNNRIKRILRCVPVFLISVNIIFLLVPPCFSVEKVLTKVIVRVVSKDSKVIGSGVGGALVRIKNLETGEILAQGKQEGGTGDTDRIMVQPRKRGAVIFGTPDAAFFQAEIPLDKPTQIEIYTEAPLGYPHANQKGSKTLTLIPGKHILGEGVIIELNGLIVNILSPSPKESLKKGEGVLVRAEVRML